MPAPVLERGRQTRESTCSIDEYEKEGLEFVGLRLKPGAGVKAMKPVRVISPGAGTTFPMRMLQAGSGDKVALKLFVITEGRAKAEGFPDGLVNQNELTWDFSLEESNYEALREKALAAGDGTTWLTTFADTRSILAPLVADETTGEPVDTANAATANANTDSGFMAQSSPEKESYPARCFGCSDTTANRTSCSRSVL